MKQLIILYLSIVCSIYGSTPEIRNNDGLMPTPQQNSMGKSMLHVRVIFSAENNADLSQEISAIPFHFNPPFQVDVNNSSYLFLYIWAVPGSELNRINGIILDHQLNQAYLQITVQEPAKKIEPMRLLSNYYLTYYV